MPNNPVQNAWATVKADLATAQAALVTAQANLATLEADCDVLYGLGAGDIVDWLRTQIRQTLLGRQPRVSTGGNTAPQILAVWAAQPGARDLTTVDQRPISSTATGAANGLS
jgi:hypothetical protein